MLSVLFVKVDGIEQAVRLEWFFCGVLTWWLPSTSMSLNVKARVG